MLQLLRLLLTASELAEVEKVTEKTPKCLSRPSLLGACDLTFWQFRKSYLVLNKFKKVLILTN